LDLLLDGWQLLLLRLQLCLCKSHLLCHLEH
jgi:hypothetical protein